VLSSSLLLASSVLLVGSEQEIEARFPSEEEAPWDDLLSMYAIRRVPLTLLPQRGDESPACLDGSPYGLYFRPSATNSTKWTIYLQGGGWCYNEEQCLARSKSRLGSSRLWRRRGGVCPCMNVKEDGTMDGDCNCIFMPYCDGASFSGFRPKPWPVQSAPGKFLFFRGIKNFDATMDFAFAHGLDKATEFVLTGSSAGGLSTFLHADRIASRLGNCTHVRAAPVVGYFLDHDNYKHNWHTYTARMKHIYHNMQNLTFGPDGGLTAACQRAYPANPHYCFMSPHMQKFIHTPFFMFNSKYDKWQLDNELQAKFKRPAAEAAVLQYGKDFLTQFSPVQGEPKHGAMITSCICHGCPWGSLKLDGKNSYQHYADWYYGKTSGATAIHIDTRNPNGDGTIKLRKCIPLSTSDSRKPKFETPNSRFWHHQTQAMYTVPTPLLV